MRVRFRQPRLYRAPCITLTGRRYFCSFVPLQKKSKYSLVNLLADEEIYPEFLSDRCEADGVSRRMLEWLANPQACEQVRAKLGSLRQAAARPGACERSARFILDRLNTSRSGRRREAA